MKQYFTGFFTAVCLTASVFIFMGSQNKNLGDIKVNSIYITGELGTTLISGGVMGIKNKDGNYVNLVEVNDEGGGQLQTFNADGNRTAYVGTGEGGIGFLTTHNEHGVMTGYFGTNNKNDGVAALSDRYGDVGWSASGKQ